MCVAVPLKILRIEGNRAHVASGGAELDVGLDLVDDPAVGQYVLVHAGYAIQCIDENEALETLAVLNKVVESWPK